MGDLRHFMNAPDFRAKLREVPHKPGVYLMKDRLGSIIYVGKALDLRKRMSSYFMASQKMRASIKTRALIDSIHDFEFHTVRNEEESLLLEGKLIKDYREFLRAELDAWKEANPLPVPILVQCKVVSNRRLTATSWFHGSPTGPARYFKMSRSTLPPEIRDLPVAERVALVERIWDSIVEDEANCLHGLFVDADH